MQKSYHDLTVFAWPLSALSPEQGVKFSPLTALLEVCLSAEDVCMALPFAEGYHGSKGFAPVG